MQENLTTLIKKDYCIVMKFRETLKDELIFKNIQSKELASRTGISLHTINHYLTQNGNSPSAENAYKIAKVLCVSVEYLLTGKTSDSDTEINPRIKNIIHQLNYLEDEDLCLLEKLLIRFKKNS